MKSRTEPGDEFLCLTNPEYKLRYVESFVGIVEGPHGCDHDREHPRHRFKIVPTKGGLTQEAWLDHEGCLMGVKLVGRRIYSGPFEVGNYYVLEDDQIYRCMSVMKDLAGTFIMFLSNSGNTPKRVLDQFGRDLQGNPVVVKPYKEEPQEEKP